MEANKLKHSQSYQETTSVGIKRMQKRFLQKDGSCNVYFKHIFGEWESYVTDIFTTLVDIKWRHMFVIFSLSYILSWLLFGLVFWLIALQHGDLLPEEEVTPCVDNVNSFTGAFLFSLETQTTIGYGFRCVTNECSAAILTVVLQSVLGCIIDTFIIGAALAKMATARKRAQTIRFSYYATVGLRDGKLCLMWRIGDFRPNHMVEGTVRAQLLRYVEDRVNRMILEYKDLKLLNDQIILATPVTIVHEINQDSPLYDLDRKTLAKDNFEILVTFVYTGDSTGTSHQSRSSYVPREILWGHRFNDVLQLKKKYYKVNCLQFEETTEGRKRHKTICFYYSRLTLSVLWKLLKAFSNPNGKLTSLVNARPHKELVYVKVLLGRMLSEMKLNPYGGFKILQCLFQIIDQVPLLEMKYHIVSDGQLLSKVLERI
ncbi:hypothetical protein Chor_012256 [Crotalus horridus]